MLLLLLSGCGSGEGNGDDDSDGVNIACPSSQPINIFVPAGDDAPVSLEAEGVSFEEVNEQGDLVITITGCDPDVVGDTDSQTDSTVTTTTTTNSNDTQSDI